MTLPREILPGRTYLITRRCTRRQFLLRPSRLTNQIIEYCLALAADRTGISLHAVCHEGELRETLTLRFLRPPIFVGLSDAQVQARLNAELAVLVKRARQDMALCRLLFVGPNAVLRQSFSAVPKTPALRRNPSPRIAAKSTPARVNAIRRMLEFVQHYGAA